MSSSLMLTVDEVPVRCPLFAGSIASTDLIVTGPGDRFIIHNS
jgi:hypothetical protein